MNDQTRESLVYEISERNRKINALKREIDIIYAAASHLIDHAKKSDGGYEALRKWDKVRPDTHYGEKR